VPSNPALTTQVAYSRDEEVDSISFTRTHEFGSNEANCGAGLLPKPWAPTAAHALAPVALAQAASARGQDNASRRKGALAVVGNDGDWQAFVNGAVQLARKDSEFAIYFKYVLSKGGWQTFKAMQDANQLLYGQVSSDKSVLVQQSGDGAGKVGWVSNDLLLNTPRENSMQVNDAVKRARQVVNRLTMDVQQAAKDAKQVEPPDQQVVAERVSEV